MTLPEKEEALLEQKLRLVSKKRCCFCKPVSNPFPKLSPAVSSVPNNVQTENILVQPWLWRFESEVFFTEQKKVGEVWVSALPRHSFSVRKIVLSGSGSSEPAFQEACLSGSLYTAFSTAH